MAIGIASMLLGAAGLGLLGVGVASPGWRLPTAAVSVLLGAGVGGGGAFVIYLLLIQRIRTEEAWRQNQALVNIRPLAGSLPLDLYEWAVDPALIELVIRTILRRRPGLIVECGSGWSTVLIGRCLSELGVGRIVALEHQESFARKTRHLLKTYNASQRARVIHAPIKDREVDGRIRLWYGEEADHAIAESIDILLVDGPPADVAPRSRHPAVPLLQERLATDAVVILDDGRREDEKWIAREWANRLRLKPRFVDSGCGVWVFESEKRSGFPSPA